MKKFELFCILFILFVYENYIKEDWTDYNQAGKIFLFIPWLVRSMIFWIICPIFLPEYLFKQSEIYKQIQKTINHE